VGKLTGIRVIDLSLFLPGPMMTMMMADQGAEVIKIEPLTGDPARDQARRRYVGVVSGPQSRKRLPSPRS
jgi:crotonobetainyl-CoA:carnitine CoA-transferase CaiB-like acyl-CoA transferase